MNLITRKEFLEILGEKANKKIQINVMGPVSFKINFNNFSFGTENDEIRLMDEKNSDYIGFNLNNVSNMQYEENRIICILDDETNTIIEVNF